MDNIDATINNEEMWMKIGRNLFIFISIIFASHRIFNLLVHWLMPEFKNNISYSIIISLISVNLFALPVYLILMRRLPNSKKGEKKKISIFKLYIIFSIALAIGLIGNIIGILVNGIFSILRGKPVINPVTNVLKGNPLLLILYAGIVAPIVEEVIFRKVLIDKIRRYGDLIAILTSGIGFGLMHMNLHQFFYATAIGIIFAYITIKTNTVRYAIVIHMAINLNSSFIALLVAKEDLLILFIFVLIYLITATIGLCVFITNIKKYELEVGDIVIINKKRVIFNSWIICYIVICGLSMVMNILL